MTGLAPRIALADLAVTGEGHLDPPSFEGKVPGGVLGLAAGRCPVLCIVGAADKELLRSPPAASRSSAWPHDSVGHAPAAETCALIADVTREALPRFAP